MIAAIYARKSTEQRHVDPEDAKSVALQDRARAHLRAIAAAGPSQRRTSIADERSPGPMTGS